MTDNEKEQVLKEAIKCWGADKQIDMIIEECGELIVALQKLKRGGKTDHVIDEIADVSIMMKQAGIIFGASAQLAIQERMEFKINRLKGRIDRHKLNEVLK